MNAAQGADATAQTPPYRTAWGALQPVAPPAHLALALRVYDTLGSTNDVCRELAVAGAPEGLLVAALEQTRGRGRQGRPWSSPSGAGVYLSALARPLLPSQDAGWFALLGGVAVAEALEGLGLRGVRVKWPNDVFAPGGKIAGVLVEPRLAAGRIEFAVVGIGVNVRQRKSDFEPALQPVATSLLAEGVDAAPDRVAARVVDRLNARYADVLGGRTERESLFAAWRERGGLDLLPELA